MRVTCILVLLLATTAAAVNPDVPFISSRHDPAPPVDLLPAQELWRLTDGDEDELMGVTADVTVDDDGNTLILDRSFKTVRIVDADGQTVGMVGREGDGPGEFRSPEQCLALPDGRIGVAELFPAKIVTLQRDGTPAASIELPAEGSMSILSEVFCRAGRVQACWSELIMGEGGLTNASRLQSLDAGSNILATFKRDDAETEQQGGAVTVTRSGEDFAHHWAAGYDGRVYVAGRQHAYEIEVFTPDGELDHVISVEYESVERTDEEIKAIEEERASLSFNGIQADLGEIDPYLRDIQSLHPRPDGSLWVRSSRAMRDRPEGTVGAFDVFDAQGKFVRRVAVDVPFERGYDEWRLVGDRLYLLKENLNAPAPTGIGAGGGAEVIRIGGPPKPAKDDDREPQPFAVICYQLSD